MWILYFPQFSYHYYLNQRSNWVQAYHNTISAAGSWRSLLTLKREIKIVSMYIQLQNFYTADIDLSSTGPNEGKLPKFLHSAFVWCEELCKPQRILPTSLVDNNLLDLHNSSHQTQPHPIIFCSKRVIVLTAGLSPFHLVTLMVPWIPACLGAPADEQIKGPFQQ